MPLYKYTNEALEAVHQDTLTTLGIKERDDLQRVLRDNIEAVSPDTLVIAEEYSNWKDSNRRIDLLGIDPDGSIVVIELKRTEDGGHMDLQAIRYAAMVSTLTFDQVVDAYDRFSKAIGKDADAKESLLAHLNCEPEDIGEQTRIVLVSADFSSEISTAALWLNQQGLNVTCIRLTAYKDVESIYFDAQQIIPLPEAADFMVKSREKADERKSSRVSRGQDNTQYIVTYKSEDIGPLNKRFTMYELVTRMIAAGVSPEELQQHLGSNRFVYCDGEVNNAMEFELSQLFSLKRGTTVEYNNRRFHSQDDQLINFSGRTYQFSNQWGHQTYELAKALCLRFPQVGITVREA